MFHLRSAHTQIETFCFEVGGTMDISVKDFSALSDGKDASAVRAGFIMVKTRRSENANIRVD